LKTLPASVLFILSVLLVSCSNTALRWTPEYHTVKAGETLYSIAESYNLDYRQLASLNGIDNSSMIREGQRLRLKGSVASSGSSSRKSSAPAEPVLPAPSWGWPTKGSVYLRFGASPKTESGIRIAGKTGQDVNAVAAGEVVYAGSGLASYGQLLIIEHNQTWLSAYGFNSTLLVEEGRKVKSGQTVALMGKDAAGKAVLHFEIRKNGQPVDPLRYLPGR